MRTAAGHVPEYLNYRAAAERYCSFLGFAWPREASWSLTEPAAPVARSSIATRRSPERFPAISHFRMVYPVASASRRRGSVRVILIVSSVPLGLDAAGKYVARRISPTQLFFSLSRC